MLVMNLLQSLVSTAVEFDFHHIDVIRRFDDDVNTAAMGGALHFGLKAHHLEDDIHAVLKVELHLAHYLVTVVGKHRLQTFHEASASPRSTSWMNFWIKNSDSPLSFGA